MLPQIGDVTTFLQTLQGLTDAFMIMFSTPDNFTFGLMGLKGLWQGFSLVANALMVVFLIVGVMQIMIGRSTGKKVGMTPQELVIKFMIQAIGINTSYVLVQALVAIENTICANLLAATVTSILGKASATIKNFTPATMPADPQQRYVMDAMQINLRIIQNNLVGTALTDVILAIIGMIFLVVLFVIFFQSVVRLLRLNLFLVLSPLAFPFLMLEQTQEYGSFILKTLVITIFVQALQVGAFCLTLVLLVSGFTAGAFAQSLMKLIMVIGLLIAVASIPRLITRLGLPGGSGGFNTALGTVKSQVGFSVNKLITKNASRRDSRSERRNGHSDRQNGNAGRQGVRPLGQRMHSGKQSSGEPERASGRGGQQQQRGSDVSVSERKRPAVPRGSVRRPITSGPQDAGMSNNERSRSDVSRSRTRKFSGSGSSVSRQDGAISAVSRQDGARARWRATGGSASRRSRERRSRMRRSR